MTAACFTFMATRIPQQLHLKQGGLTLIYVIYLHEMTIWRWHVATSRQKLLGIFLLACEFFKWLINYSQHYTVLYQSSMKFATNKAFDVIYRQFFYYNKWCLVSSYGALFKLRGLNACSCCVNFSCCLPLFTNVSGYLR